MNISKSLVLNNTIDIPRIGLGVWQIPNDDVSKVVQWAIAAGYRHIDTAKIYRNEEGVGQGIYKSGIKRSDIFVTTKLWITDTLNPNKGLVNSLSRLGLDYIDLYLIHWPFPFWRDIWKNLEKSYKEGRAKAIGVSNFNIDQLKSLKKVCGFNPAVVQVEISPYFFKKELIDYCHSEGIVVEAYSPLTRNKRLNDEFIIDLAKAYKKSGAQIMIRWALQHDLVVLPKSKNKNHLESNIDVFDFEISNDDMKKLDSLNENYSALFR